MSQPISRVSERRARPVAQSAFLSSAFNMEPFAYGLIISPSAVDSSAVLGFYVSDAPDGTYVPLYDEDGNVVQIDALVADRAYVMPAEVAAAAWVKIWQQASAANVPAEAARSYVIMLKG